MTAHVLFRTRQFHGRSGLMHVMMGSVAEAVMRSSDIPLLTVRSPAGEAYEPGRRRLVL